MAELPNLKKLNWSRGRGFRTLPVVPSRWIFGRRSFTDGRYYFALRGASMPVLILKTPGWTLDGVMASTEDASRFSDELALAT